MRIIPGQTGGYRREKQGTTVEILIQVLPRTFRRKFEIYNSRNFDSGFDLIFHNNSDRIYNSRNFDSGFDPDNIAPSLESTTVEILIQVLTHFMPR